MKQIKTILEEQAMFRVTVAKEGRMTANLIMNDWDNYDCVIMERDLPLQDSFPLAKAIRNYEKSLRLERAQNLKPPTTSQSGKFLHHRMPLICFTLQTKPEDIKKYMRFDMDGCISALSPIDATSLLTTIRQAVPHHLAYHVISSWKS